MVAEEPYSAFEKSQSPAAGGVTSGIFWEEWWCGGEMGFCECVGAWLAFPGRPAEGDRASWARERRRCLILSLLVVDFKQIEGGRIAEWKVFARLSISRVFAVFRQESECEP